MIVIVDYGMGNLRSVEKAAQFLGKTVKVSSSAAVIKKAKKIIFPGVGHFGKAVGELKKRNIFNVLIERIKEGVPFLGICLGMQLLLGASEEARGIKGLGVIAGRVKKFNPKNVIVPHMGWNQVAFKTEDLFRKIPNNSFFYFAHSYYCVPLDKKVILATTDYDITFTSALRKDNVWGVQFHPEKSQALGLKVFNNFLEL
ncbi:MAG: imidazole glycerol phosphate synthase subunit HisH [Candidatus Omnitrophica bacterium]|nr:imidazole glycerol phosphate synthase subunit HisH [Candidatus Omnitrophota bacterium]